MMLQLKAILENLAASVKQSTSPTPSPVVGPRVLNGSPECGLLRAEVYSPFPNLMKAVNRMRQYIIGVDVGGTKVAGGLVDLKARLVKSVVVPTLAAKGFKTSFGKSVV